MTEKELADIRKRDAESAETWFTGPASFTARAARDRRALLTALSIQSTKDDHVRNDQMETPEASAAAEANGRFFIDHGVVHDRKTGQHVEAEPQHAERLLALLQSLDCVNGVVNESQMRDAARYRAFRYIVYTLKDDSFDAYDDEGMDAELDRRIATDPAVALAARPSTPSQGNSA